MTLLSPPFALGAAGQVLSGKLLRLSGGAPFRPGATGVLGVSGVLAGPPNTMGELALPNNTSVTVQAFRAVIQNTQDATQGQYEVTNDAAVTLGAADGFPAQDATQFRRAYVLVAVDDSQVSGVASSATTDRARLYVLGGALAATAGAAALPALPNNPLALGELLVPPTGQTVTLTPYNPRTTTRGGILPVLVDGSTVTGHDGAPPGHDGQARWHPSHGLQLALGGAWGPAVLSIPSMASRPTGSPAGTQVYSVAEGRTYTFTGTYWCDRPAEGATGWAAGAAVPAGAYLTTVSGTVFATPGGAGTFFIPLGRTYSANALLGMVSPGDTVGTLGQVGLVPGSYTTTQGAGIARTAAGALITSGSVRVNWQFIGYNT